MKEEVGKLQRDIYFIWRALKRKRLAAVAAYLFHLHKNNIEYWVLVHRELMSTALNHSELSAIATVIAASKMETLGDAAISIPGLTQNSSGTLDQTVE